MKKRKITVSPNSGFCFGVKRALDIAGKAIKARGVVYSLGPIIHNPQVVREFSEKGLKIIKGINDVSERHAAVLVPSHGINPRALGKKRLTCIDTTCPLVGRVQKIVSGLKKKGYFIIIVGDKNHPEVRGLAGIAGKQSSVVKNKKEAKALNLKSGKVALISQTTASVSNFRDVVSVVAKKDLAELAAFNTVCRNTSLRRKNAELLAAKVEAMIVIGGRQSANTSKLISACRKVNANTCGVESAKDLKAKFLKGKKSIGIATGASTPQRAIDEVVKKIRRV